MTPEEINREIAEKVMEWTKHDICKAWWFPKKTPLTLEDAIFYWDPYHRWDHAGIVLEKFPNWTMSKNEPQYYCKMGTCFDKPGIWADTAPAAICLAALLQIGVDVQAQEAVKNV